MNTNMGTLAEAPNTVGPVLKPILQKRDKRHSSSQPKKQVKLKTIHKRRGSSNQAAKDNAEKVQSKEVTIPKISSKPIIKRKKNALLERHQSSPNLVETNSNIAMNERAKSLSLEDVHEGEKPDSNDFFSLDYTKRLFRQNSCESFSKSAKTSRMKQLEQYMPRRRFSQGAIEPIRDILVEIEEEDNERKRSVQESAQIRPKEFFEMSRDERLEELKCVNDSTTSSKDWVGLRSLTGANASGWKFQDSFYGNFNVGRRPSMDTAWGRRVYDQYEIEYDVEKPKYGYLMSPGGVPESLTKKQELRELGIWDVVFNREVVPVIEGAKHWEADHEDKLKAIKKHNIDMARLDEDVVIGNKEDPVCKFKLQFCKTGSYLRPDDMRFCVEKTNFTEDQIIDWFKRFRNDCPDGKLTRDHLRQLFRQAFPNGDGEKFSRHIMRLFDSDGNGFLDFKEFLLAIDIATCQTEESKLSWVFKLYDVDNDGIIDVNEMAAIMETMECLESRRSSLSIGSASIGDDPVPSTPLERAQNLFNCLEHENPENLTREEFIAGYLERNVLMAKQDAVEQKQKLDCLILRGPLVPNIGEVSEDRLPFFVAGLFTKRSGIEVEGKRDLANVHIRPPTENYPKSIFVRFIDIKLRMKIWSTKMHSRKNGLLMEEWLTEHRAKLYKKLKELKSKKLIKDCMTNDGEVFAIVANKAGTEIERILVISEEQYESVIKLTKQKYPDQGD